MRNILIINPNTSEDMTRSIEKSANDVKLPDTKIKCVNVQLGPRVIETYLEDEISSNALLETIIEHQDIFDAFVIAASPDPGLFPAREAIRKPVVGIGLSPMLIAPLIGTKFSILGHWAGDKPRSEDKVNKYKLASNLGSIRVYGESPLDIHDNPANRRQRLIILAKKAIENDLADVLIMAGAAFAGMQKSISEELNIPVLEGISCAVKLAEVLIDLDVLEY